MYMTRLSLSKYFTLPNLAVQLEASWFIVQSHILSLNMTQGYIKFEQGDTTAAWRRGYISMKYGRYSQ